MRFGFYGRVSTEDQQDPEASRSWQLSRATQLVEPAGGTIVEEFFDIGQSRSLPWKRRPEAARLLDAISDPARGFDAVVIAEPQRAFYGNQFGLTFPVFVHYGVELWVPEVGGKIDPGSEAHDLVMMLFAGMSKGERNRIKIRVRRAMASMAATEGRFLGGRPPYGYQLGDAGPHPNPSKAADGKRLHRLEVNPATAPIVVRIFDEYLGGLGIYAIAAGLTRDGIPSPSASDPERNRNRNVRAWSKSAVHVILSNPRYTGREVWNKQRKDEVLLDVDDVALGHETKMRWNDKGDWIWSAELAHEPIIPTETFVRVAEQFAAGRNRPATRKPRADNRAPYVLRGLLHCGLCGRRMQGNIVRGGARRYRCRTTDDYALEGHPRQLYVGEAIIVRALDGWISSLFDAERIDTTVAEIVAACSDATEADGAARDAAQRKIADCDERLGKYRAALDSGADPGVVSAWIAEVQGAKLAAQRTLVDATRTELTHDEVRATIDALGDIIDALARADAEAKAELYAALGLRLTYRPGDRTTAVTLAPDRRGLMDVSEGGSRPYVPPPALRAVLALDG